MREVKINGINYNLIYGFNAVCKLEQLLGKNLSEIAQELDKGSFDVSLVRAIFWAGLVADNRNITVDKAGELLDIADNPMEICKEAINELVLSTSKFAGNTEENTDTPQKKVKA